MMNSELKNLWAQRIVEQRNSGKSIAGWCKENSLKINQYYYWRKKLSADEEYSKQQVEWLSVQINPRDIVLDSIKVQIGPATIDIRKGFNPQLFNQIVQVLLTL